MADILSNVTAWHWMTLAIVLLAIDVLGLPGFLLGLAAGAFVTGIAHSLIDLSWQAQLFLFSVSGVIFTVLYWKLFRDFNQRSDTDNINQRAAHQIGKQGRIIEDESTGVQKVQLGDVLWRFECEDTVNDGDRVKILDVQGMVLMIEKI